MASFHEVCLRHAKHYEGVLRTIGDLYRQGGEAIKDAKDLSDLEWDNIKLGQEHIVKYIRTDNNAAKLCSDYCGYGIDWLFLRQHPCDMLSWLEAAIDAARSLNDRRAEGVHLGNKGNAYRRLGKFKFAIESFEQASVIANEVSDLSNQGVWLDSLGVVYKNLGQTRRAIEFYENSLIITRKIGNRRGEAYTLGNLGEAYAALGEIRSAIEHHNQSLAICKEIGDRHGESAALGNLGVAHKNLGEVKQAIEFLEQQLTITRDIGDRDGESTALGNLGVAHKNLGELQIAIEYYQQQLKLVRDIGDRQSEGNVEGNLGSALGLLGNYQLACEHQERCLVIAREIGDRRLESIALGNLGVTHMNLGELEYAINLFKQYQDIAREIGDRRLESIALRNLDLALSLKSSKNKSNEGEGLMNFFKKIFGKRSSSESASVGEKISLYELTLAQGIPISREQCEICRSPFYWPQNIVALSTPANYVHDLVLTGGEKTKKALLSQYTIDIGGYCPTCRKKVCSKHVVLVDHQILALGMVPGCKKCGSALEPKS